MDKNKKIKPVLAVCFVVLCGAGYVGMRYLGQESEQIVFEKAPKEQGTPTTDADRITNGPRETEQDEGKITSSGEQPEAFVCVHICGAVVSEGVYTLHPGSRVADGIAAAGGFTEAADRSYHNLAALLSDGQKVYVPTTDETKELSVPERTASANGAESGDSGKVNINTAGLEKLMTLSGIGEAKAQSILQYRERVGPFQRIEELKNVSGIGDAMFERVKEQITVK